MKYEIGKKVVVVVTFNRQLLGAIGTLLNFDTRIHMASGHTEKVWYVEMNDLETVCVSQWQLRHITARDKCFSVNGRNYVAIAP